MKKCPFCAEEIQDEAIKCKHCQSMLTEQNTPDQTEEPVVEAVELKKKEENKENKLSQPAKPSAASPSSTFSFKKFARYSCYFVIVLCIVAYILFVYAIDHDRDIYIKYRNAASSQVGIIPINIYMQMDLPTRTIFVDHVINISEKQVVDALKENKWWQFKSNERPYIIVREKRDPKRREMLQFSPKDMRRFYTELVEDFRFESSVEVMERLTFELMENDNKLYEFYLGSDWAQNAQSRKDKLLWICLVPCLLAVFGAIKLQ